MKYKILVSAVLLIIVLLSVGCGGETETSKQTETAAKTTTAVQTTVPSTTIAQTTTETQTQALTEVVTTVTELNKKPVVKTTKKPATTKKTTTKKSPPVKITHNGYTKQQVIDYFEKTAFGSEKGGRIDYICKRTSKIYYYINGVCLDDDLRTIEKIAAQLNDIYGFPGIERTDDFDKANMILNFADPVALVPLVPGYGILDSGYCKCALDESYQITKASIAINNTMLLRSERNTVIMEEMIQSLGLANDSPDYEESLFYDGWTTPAEPASIDWALVKLLYHPSVKVGMSKAKAMQVVKELLG